jgi:hypothetical protein
MYIERDMVHEKSSISSARGTVMDLFTGPFSPRACFSLKHMDEALGIVK